MRDRANDFRSGKPYDEIGQISSASIKQNVESGGRPTWKPRKYQYPHPILDKSGAMRDKAELSALLAWTHSGQTHIKKIVGPLYGLFHQYTGIKTKVGSSIQKVVRKYVVFQPDEIKRMGNAFTKAFLRK